MQLNKEWDNMPLPNREDGDPQYEARRYLTKRNVYVKDGAPKMDIEDMPEEYLASEDIEGITITSVLQAWWSDMSGRFRPKQNQYIFGYSICLGLYN